MSVSNTASPNAKYQHAFVEEGVLVDASAVIGPGAVVLRGVAGVTTRIDAKVVVGANATVLGGVQLAEGCVVEPGAVIRQDVPPRVVVGGNPAAIVGYAQAGISAEAGNGDRSGIGIQRETVAGKLLTNGARLIELPQVRDLRGSLSVGEAPKQLPFVPHRYFLVFDVPSAEVRGEHAHHACHQFLVCVAGQCSAVVDDGAERHEVCLHRKNLGLYMPPMTWGVQYKYSSDAVLMVLASRAYDPADYIRDYSEFLKLVRGGYSWINT